MLPFDPLFGDRERSPTRHYQHSLKWVNLIPLDAALGAMREHLNLKNWCHGSSVYKLVFILCLPQMRAPLEAAKLLVCNKRIARKVFFDSVKEGFVVGMASMLMVARELILPPRAKT